jgi:hypothetical protein
MTKRTYGIYEVTESFTKDGLWQGYKVRCVDSIGKKQGKLYIKSDGRENYQAKPKDEELEI